MATESLPVSTPIDEITYRQYESEADLPPMMDLVGSELSEPYIVFTYRYFLSYWPHLSFLAFAPSSPSPSSFLDLSNATEPVKSVPVGVIVCKQDVHKSNVNRGYIAMLSVHKAWRKRGIARNLLTRAVDMMKLDGAKEVVLETEYDNVSALRFYASMGFMREKRLFRFYMNGKDAFRLVLPLEDSDESDTDSRGTVSTLPLPQRVLV